MAVANPGDVLGVRVRVQVRSTGVTARLRVGMRVRVERRVGWACLMRAVKRTALVLAALALLMAVGVSRPASAWASAPAQTPAPMECGTSAACEATIVDDGSGRGSSGPVAVAALATPPAGPMGSVAGMQVWMESTQRRCPCPPAPEHVVWPD
jgi:hypothetical protein